MRRTTEPRVSGKAWYVPSATDPTQDGIVGHAAGFDRWSCSCKDWERRGAGLGACKRVLAVKIPRACKAWKRGAYGATGRSTLTPVGRAYLE